MTLYAVGGETIYPDDFVNLVIDSTAYFLNLTAPPQVISTSYGTDEDSITLRLAVYVSSLSLNLIAQPHPVTYATCLRNSVLGAYRLCSLPVMAVSLGCTTTRPARSSDPPSRLRAPSEYHSVFFSQFTL